MPDRESSGPGLIDNSIDVSFDGEICRHAAECVRGMPEVFDVGKRPWIDPTSGIFAMPPATSLESDRSGDSVLENRSDVITA